VLVGITSGGKVGVALLAGALIVFALLSSFVLPRRSPDFPGNRLGLFALVAVLLFAGTMAGIVVFATESEEGHGAEGAATEGTQTGEEPATTETSTTGTAPAESQGDPAAGKTVFTSAGCTSCHTLEAAGATGSVGPNLDEAKPDHDLVVERVTNGMGVMPSFKGQLDEQQIQNVAAFVVQSTSG
jgi:cytochrome c6